MIKEGMMLNKGKKVRFLLVFLVLALFVSPSVFAKSPLENLKVNVDNSPFEIITNFFNGLFDGDPIEWISGFLGTLSENPEVVMGFLGGVIGASLLVWFFRGTTDVWVRWVAGISGFISGGFLTYLGVVNSTDIFEGLGRVIVITIIEFALIGGLFWATIAILRHTQENAGPGLFGAVSIKNIARLIFLLLILTISLFLFVGINNVVTSDLEDLGKIAFMLNPYLMEKVIKRG